MAAVDDLAGAAVAGDEVGVLFFKLRDEVIEVFEVSHQAVQLDVDAGGGVGPGVDRFRRDGDADGWGRTPWPGANVCFESTSASRLRERFNRRRGKRI